MVFDRVLGHITSYTFRGMPLLDRGPQPDFWRAITDNDWGAWKSIVNAARKDPGIDITCGGRRERRGECRTCR